MSVSNTTLESILCQSNNMQQAGQCRCLNHDQSVGVGFGVHPVGSNCIYQYGYKKSLTDKDITELILEYDSDVTHVHRKMKTYLLRETVTQVTLLTQASHSELTVQTVDLPGYNKQRHPTSITTLLLSVLVLFFFEIMQLFS
jgi:hypothetical protein